SGCVQSWAKPASHRGKDGVVIRKPCTEAGTPGDLHLLVSLNHQVGMVKYNVDPDAGPVPHVNRDAALQSQVIRDLDGHDRLVRWTTGRRAAREPAVVVFARSFRLNLRS